MQEQVIEMNYKNEEKEEDFKSSDRTLNDPTCFDNCLTYSLSLIIPCYPLFCSCVTVNPREEMLVLTWKKPAFIFGNPGIHCFNPIGRDFLRISTSIRTTQLNNALIADKIGNPINVSTIINWRVVDAQKALLNVENINSYVFVQAELSLREHAHKFPYDSNDEKVECLKRPTDQMNEQLRVFLQSKLANCGVRVLQFCYTNITYKESMEKTLLAQQEASALLLARETIVKGITGIALHALQNLEHEGVEFSKQERTAFLSNMHYLLAGKDDQPKLFQLKLK